MKRVKTKPKNQTREDNIRRQERRNLTDKIMLIAALTTVDEFGINDEQLCAWYNRFARYSRHIKLKAVDLEYVQSLIERDCDVELKGWKNNELQ